MMNFEVRMTKPEVAVGARVSNPPVETESPAFISLPVAMIPDPELF